MSNPLNGRLNSIWDTQKVSRPLNRGGKYKYYMSFLLEQGKVSQSRGSTVPALA